MMNVTRTLLLLLLALALFGCAPSAARTTEGVSIYLPVQPRSGRDILAADLSRLALQEQPLVAAGEIVSYSASSHDLELTAGAIDRLAMLKVPVQGLGFVFCDGRTPLLAGAFWTPISSLSFDGLTINVPWRPQESRLHLYSGYPMQDEPLPNDPRNDARLLETFRRAGKLR